MSERTREIGLRAAVGATPGGLRWQFLLEALLLSLVGGLVGVLVGVGGSELFGRLGGMPGVIVPASHPAGLWRRRGRGRVLWLLSRQQGAHMDPIQALRHE